MAENNAHERYGSARAGSQVISQDHEAIRIAERERTQEDAFDERKDGDHRPNAESQRENDSQSEAG